MAAGILINCKNSTRRKAQYIFVHIFTVLGIPYRILYDENDLDRKDGLYDLYVCYGTKDLPAGLGGIHTRRCVINIHGGIPDDKPSYWQHELPPVDYISKNDVDKLPVFYEHIQLETRNSSVLYRYSRDQTAAIQVRENGNVMLIDIGFDIIECAFFMLSRLEEVISSERDSHGRFPASQSLALANGFLQQPVIDEYIRIIYDLLKMGYAWSGIDLPTIPLWPDNREFAVCLTHDVDEVKKWKFKGIFSQCLLAARLITRLEFKELTRIMIVVIKSIVLKAYYWLESEDTIFEEIIKIIKLEALYHFKSCFYFCGGGKSYGIDYSPQDDTIRDTIRYIHRHGWEIGMHGSYDSYNNKEVLLEEKKALEAVLGSGIKGIRQHYLRFEPSQTWYIQSGIDLTYDTTLGYADQMGFRAGTTFPFFPYYLPEDKELPVIEIPLAVMDATLFDYMKDSPQQAWAHTKNILDTVMKYHGVCVLLWHQDALDNDLHPGWGEVYSMLLNYLSRQNAWVASGTEIAEWWISRKNRVARTAE